jgi:two-component system nitrogen regulation sensor histidine kinase GlnL
MDLACLDVLCTGVALLDDQGVVRHVNAAAQELLGLSRRQLLGKPATGWLAGDEGFGARFLSAVRGELGVVHQEVLVADNTLALTLAPLYGQPWAAVLELQPVPQYVRMDRKEKSARQLGIQRESLRNLAHEIKNPLGGLRAAAQLAQAEINDARLSEYTQVIIAEADRLKNLVDRLLVSQSQPRRSLPFNVHEICDRVCTLVSAEFGSGITVVRDYDASVPELCGDSPRLLQSLLNIARNAAQAVAESDMAHDGRVTLRTRVGYQAGPAGNQMELAISVIDNGPGVPAELADRVFHPFVTGRPSGTGLGLSLAHEYVQQMGGLLEFDSARGRTEFRLILPMERT